ncbi:uncharacterized protein LOC135828353 [Sycon ciliatum]|uniref:uncharacterized protein LOC135828353 n=1 Tax=Sycon ciliatum TaxID=27933 RepID=UPI0031F606C7
MGMPTGLFAPVLAALLVFASAPAHGEEIPWPKVHISGGGVHLTFVAGIPLASIHFDKTCVLTESNAESLEWYKDSKVIKRVQSTARVTSLPFGFSSAGLLAHSDAGKYLCRAHYYQGPYLRQTPSPQSIDISVVDRPTDLPTVHVSANQTVTAGGFVFLSCHVEDMPSHKNNVSPSWTGPGGRPIGDQNVVVGNTFTNIHLQHVTAADSGAYTCSVGPTQLGSTPQCNSPADITQVVDCYRSAQQTVHVKVTRGTK